MLNFNIKELQYANEKESRNARTGRSIYGSYLVRQMSICFVFLHFSVEKARAYALRAQGYHLYFTPLSIVICHCCVYLRLSLSGLFR